MKTKILLLILLLFFFYSCRKSTPHYQPSIIYPPIVPFDTTGVSGFFAFVKNIEYKTGAIDTTRDCFGFLLSTPLISLEPGLKLVLDSLEFTFNGGYYTPHKGITSDTPGTWILANDTLLYLSFSDTNKFPRNITTMPDSILESHGFSIVPDSVYTDSVFVTISPTSYTDSGLFRRSYSSHNGIVKIDSAELSTLITGQYFMAVTTLSHTEANMSGKKYIFFKEINTRKKVWFY